MSETHVVYVQVLLLVLPVGVFSPFLTLSVSQARFLDMTYTDSVAPDQPAHPRSLT